MLEGVRSNANRGVISYLSGFDFFGFDVMLAGWGLSNNGLHPSIMETVDVKVLTIDQCKRQIEKVTRKKFQVTSQIICTMAKPYGLIQPVSIFLI